MRILDLALNALTVFAATVFIAYVGLNFGTGLFTTLPDRITEFFLSTPALQYVASGLVIAALIAKWRVGKEIKRRKAERRVRPSTTT